MNARKLIFASLWHYRRTSRTVLAGVVVAVAVLTGALMVGDSVKHSLQRIAQQRLGMIRLAVIPGDRLFRQELAREIEESTGGMAAPVFATTGIAISNDNNTRINRVEVTGIGKSFTGFWGGQLAAPAAGEAILSRNTAARLGVDTGDMILLRLEPREKASRNAPFIPDRQEPVALNLRVAALAGDGEFGRFSLHSEQTTPLNVFVNIDELSKRLNLAGLANGLLLSGEEPGMQNPAVADSLVNRLWQLSDAGLRIRPIDAGDPVRGSKLEYPAGSKDSRLNGPVNYDITSDQVFITSDQARAIHETFRDARPLLTFMVNSISTPERSTPYSFVTAVDSGMLRITPGDGEIVVNTWLADDLGVKPGDSLSLTYWVMGPMRTLREEKARFILSAIVPVEEIQSGARLMPDFPGISAAGHCRDWETGSPVDLSKIREKDEAYWKQYRGTPKAFISLKTGQRLWSNPFGSHTAFRFTASNDSLPGLTAALMERLSPRQNGIIFRPVQEDGLMAATHSTDFGQLFLGLGFFIIVASLLLTGMLFSMHVSGRMDEAGLMLAVGIRRRVVLRILLGEALIIAIAGSLVGALAGILCNALLLKGLNTLWYDAVQTSSLVAFIRPGTLALGALSGMIIAGGVMVMTLRSRRRMPLSWLLKGTPPVPVKTGLRRPRNLAAVSLLAIGTMAILITGTNRKNTTGETARHSGTGGFLLWTETTLPVVQDLNTATGRTAMNLEGEPLPVGIVFIPLQVKTGDDASCLNLNQVSNPPLMAVPAALFDSLDAFSFNTLEPSIDPDHPWLGLEATGHENLINGFADMTVITWGLQKKIGDTLTFLDERGRPLLVRLAGGLENSIFQGNILIADRHFRRYYPSVSGARNILVDITPPAKASANNGDRVVVMQPNGGMADTLTVILENLLRDYGLMAQPATVRLASFNAVENTYLTVFMMLGGMGVIIGTIGLGIILRRNIQERKSELALLRAMGFRKRLIRRMLFTEYLKILLTGIALGFIPSLGVLLPKLLSPGYQLPLTWMGIILLLIILSGLAWIWFPVRRALNRDIVRGLREE